MYNVTFDTHENTSATDTSYSISIPHMERVQCNSPGGVCVLAGRFFRLGLDFLFLWGGALLVWFSFFLIHVIRTTSFPLYL